MSKLTKAEAINFKNDKMRISEAETITELKGELHSEYAREEKAIEMVKSYILRYSSIIDRESPNYSKMLLAGLEAHKYNAEAYSINEMAQISAAGSLEIIKRTKADERKILRAANKTINQAYKTAKSKVQKVSQRKDLDGLKLGDTLSKYELTMKKIVSDVAYGEEIAAALEAHTGIKTHHMQLIRE